MRLDPSLAEAYVGLGYVYLIQGQAAEALPNFEEARRLEPEMPEALFALGIAYLETSQVPEAIAVLEAFLAIDLPAGCPGDQGLAEGAREQAQALLAELQSTDTNQ